MVMDLTSLSQTLGQQGVRPGDVLTQSAPNQAVTLGWPLNPPGNWTKFKAALSGLPLLGQIGSLRQARADVDAYPVRLGEYQASNRQILTGLREEMVKQYGADIASAAMDGMLPADGAPLTGRTVSTMLQNAERAQTQSRARNNMALTNFLENSRAGGLRAPGSTDMFGVCLARRIPLGDHTEWKGAFGPGVARFLEQQITERVKALPEYSRGAVSNEQLARIANEALDLYQELLAAPGMTSEKLDRHMAEVLAGNSGKSPKAVEALVRERVIVDENAKKMMDHHNPDSMFSRAVREQTTGHDFPELPSDVLRSISTNMVTGLRAKVSLMPEKFGCAPDATSVVGALAPRLDQKVREVIMEHQKGVELLEQDSAGPAHIRQRLGEIAQTRRIDTVQVQSYVSATRTLTDGLRALGGELRQGQIDNGAQRLYQMQARFAGSLTAMKDHGSDLWEVGSIGDSAFVKEYEVQIMSMTAQSFTPEEAREMLNDLAGLSGAQLIGAMKQSFDYTFADACPKLFGSLVAALAERAGYTPQEATRLVNGLFSQEKAVSAADLPAKLARDVFASFDQPLDDVHSAPNPANEGLVDARGVVTGSPNGARVSPGFNARQLTGEQREGILHWALRDPATGDRPWLSDAMERDANRSTFYLNGQRLGDTGSGKATVLAGFRAAFPPGPAGDAMALTVGRCANQIGIAGFVDASNLAAFPGQLTGVATGKTAHEIRANPDGSWSVRSTLATRINTLHSREPDGGYLEVPEHGDYALYSLTYRIQPPEGEGEPRVSIADSRVVFNF